MHIPLTEKLKSIPGAVGIRLEEELPFTLIDKVGDLEIRHYEEFVLARTSVMGTFEEATDKAFKKLAEFIFGKNSERITTSMTTPVFLDKTPNGWMMSFYLTPDARFIRPNDSAIKIETRGPKDVAVLKYSGTQTAEAMEHARAELLRLVMAHGMRPISDVWWAQFDQPVSLPMTKRNEAYVKIQLNN